MIAGFFLLVSLACGLFLARLLPLPLSKLERLWWSLPLGIITSTWFLFVVTSLTNYTTASIAFLLGIPVLLMVGFSCLPPPTATPVPIRGKLQWASYSCYTVFWGLLLSALFYTRMLELKLDGLYSGGGSWGDLALHSSFISMFSQQTELSLQSPVFAQEVTRYPFLLNFYSSFLYRLGLTLSQSLLIPGFILAFSLTQLLFFFVLQLTKQTRTAWFLTMFFFLNGGVGWWYFLNSFVQSDQALITALRAIEIDYTLWPEQGLQWSNVITTYLLPQRGFSVGLIVTVMVWWLWHQAFSEKPQNNWISKPGLWIAGLMAALPLFHLHSFLVLVGLAMCLSSWLLIKHKFLLKTLVAPILVLVSGAALQIQWQTASLAESAYPQLAIGWLKEDASWLLFWGKNLGLTLPLLAVAIFWLSWQALSKKPAIAKVQREFLAVTGASLAANFLLANMIQFQPYAWDNMKFMLPSFLFFCLLIAVMLSHYTKNYLSWIVIGFILFFSSLSGVLSVIRESQTSWQLASVADLELAQSIRTQTPAQTVFLTADNHNHPIPMLAGRPVVMGYRGWLWTHNVNYLKTEQAVRAMYESPATSQDLFKQYQVSYLHLGSREKASYDISIESERYFETSFEKIFDQAGERTYRVSF